MYIRFCLTTQKHKKEWFLIDGTKCNKEQPTVAIFEHILVKPSMIRNTNASIMVATCKPIDSSSNAATQDSWEVDELKGIQKLN